MMPKTQVIGTPRKRGAWLFVSEGVDAGRDFRLPQKFTIGSDPRRCELVLNDRATSAQHARIQQEGNVFFLYDLASTNGTTVNGKRIEKQILQDNDEIAIGRTRFIFKITPL